MVLAEIRKAIQSGRYPSGERLTEIRLADDLRVSRSPIREALRALEAEGLIVVSPRRGVRVASLSERDATEMVEVRAMLEGVNARLAARRRDPDIIDALHGALRQGAEASKSASVEELMRLNARFHDLLAAAGQNRILADLMRSMRDRTGVAFGPADTKLAARSWEEHAQILQAIIAGDEELASVLASRHTAKLGLDYIAGRRERKATEE